jgi:hypothetical protein
MRLQLRCASRGRQDANNAKVGPVLMKFGKDFELREQLLHLPIHYIPTSAYCNHTFRYRTELIDILYNGKRHQREEGEEGKAL